MEKPPEYVFYIVSLVMWLIAGVFFIFYATNAFNIGYNPESDTPSIAITLFATTWVVGAISLLVAFAFYPHDSFSASHGFTAQLVKLQSPVN